MAAEAAVPALRTAADSVIVSVSTGADGEAVTAVTVRSGFGAGTPMTWSSATWPLEEPEFAVNWSRTSAAVAETGTVTVFALFGLKEYVAEPARLVNPDADCSRPRTWNVWVRAPHAGSGLSFTTTALMAALAPSATVSVLGYAPGAPSQYVATSLSTALAAANTCTIDDAVAGLPTARLVPPVLLPVRVTVLLFADTFPAASRARTWYETVALSGWLSVYVSVDPLTVVRSVPLAYTS